MPILLPQVKCSGAYSGRRLHSAGTTAEPAPFRRPAPLSFAQSTTARAASCIGPWNSPGASRRSPHPAGHARKPYSSCLKVPGRYPIAFPRWSQDLRNGVLTRRRSQCGIIALWRGVARCWSLICCDDFLNFSSWRLRPAPGPGLLQRNCRPWRGRARWPPWPRGPARPARPSRSNREWSGRRRICPCGRR